MKVHDHADSMSVIIMIHFKILMNTRNYLNRSDVADHGGGGGMKLRLTPTCISN